LSHDQIQTATEYLAIQLIGIYITFKMGGNSYSLIEVTGGKRTFSSHMPKWQKYMKIEGKIKRGIEVTRR